MLGLLLDRLGSAQLGFRIDQFLRAQRASAFLALVAVGSRIAALRAGADDIAVGQEGLRLRIVILLAFLGDELVVIIELAEELRGILVVDLGSGPGIYVEVDAKLHEGVLDDPVVLVHDVLWRHTLGAGLYGDRNPVFVRPADEQHVFAAHPQVPYIDVSRYIDSGEMADVDGTVCVRKRTSHQGSLEVLFHIQTIIPQI